MTLDFAAIAVVIGGLLPVIISLFKQVAWSGRAKKWFAVTISAVAAIVFTAADLGLSELDQVDTWTQLAASAGIIYALAQTTYSGFWDTSKVDVAATSALNFGGGS